MVSWGDFSSKTKNLSHYNSCYSQIERFSNLVMDGDVNALNGLNFFSINRNVLFGLAGTIFTYELVMLQYLGESTENQNNFTLIHCY